MTSYDIKTELYQNLISIIGVKPSDIINISKSLDSIYFELKNGHIIHLKVEDKREEDSSSDMDVYNTD